MKDGKRRIRFDGVDVQWRPGGRVGARSVLTWPSGRQVVGAADDADSAVGRLRVAAAATADALARSDETSLQLELLGARTIIAFDARLVVVALLGRVNGTARQIVGAALITDQPERAAARAVLSATNRLLGESAIYLR